MRTSVVWGANTGVGKTVLSAGLTRAAVGRRLGSLYLKPVQTGVPADRTAGIGDTSSDLAIAQRVKTFGCPANAIDDVKQVAHFVSEHEQIDGVLDFMDFLMDKKP